MPRLNPNRTESPTAESAFLRHAPVERMFDLSGNHIDRMVLEGKFPKPVRIGRSVRWNKQVLLDWIAAGCPAINQGE
jgi:predicted DNA-binding transcriptional regulator AlpA